ncbi:TrbG/VirB9 family P-type conjugative transfer protein [Acidiphilium sp.]|uniref:TrbG/VirB9 family P-type conjugative transfer protein n=1 Tax=Acidiphilium sp. TaxID=527 RepID=UPI003CFD213A
MKPSTALLGGAILALAVVTPALAVEYPQPGPLDSRVRYVTYEKGNVTDIWTTVGAVVTVEFPVGTKIIGVAASDTKFLQTQPLENYLFFKPTAILSPSPVTVITQTPSGRPRHYFCQFQTVSGAAGIGANIDYAVIFRYPHQKYEAELAKQRAAEKEAVRNAARSRLQERMDVLNAQTVNKWNGPRNYDYTARGDRALAPALVYDTGYSTVFRFPGNERIPSIYEAQPDGKEASVNMSVHGDTVVVPGTAPKWWLRDGHEVLDIYDVAYNPIGRKPGTHTISRSVQREIREPNHGE